MASNYPNNIDSFFYKKNNTGKKVIINNEQITIPSLTTEKVYFVHDNIVDSSVEVWTGANKTGTKVADFLINQHSEKKWKYYLTFGSTGITYAGSAYLFYQTTGDTVEAEDINNLQESITSVQQELGVNPKGGSVNVGQRITDAEGRITGLESSNGNATKIHGRTIPTLPSSSYDEKVLSYDYDTDTVKWTKRSLGITRSIHFYVDNVLKVEANAVTFIVPINLTLNSIRLHSHIAPVGSSIIIDLNKNGTTLFTDQTTRPKILDGYNSSNTNITGSLVAGDRVTLEIDQVGSTTAGENLSVTIVCTES